MTRRRAITGAQLGLDLLMALSAAYLAYQLRFRIGAGYIPIPGGEAPEPLHYAGAAPVAAAVVAGVFGLLGIYRQPRGTLFIDELFAVVGGMSVAFLVGLALTGLYRDFTYSRITFALWAVTATFLIALARYGLRRHLAIRRARGVGVERAIVVGWGHGAEMLVQRIRMFPDYGYRLQGVLADGPPAEARINGAKMLGGIDDLEEVVREEAASMIFVALSDSDAGRALGVIERCRRCGVDFRVLPGILQLAAAQASADQIDGIPLVQYRPGLDIQGPKTAVKRAFDLVSAGLGLLLISPLMVLIAALVKATSAGPVLIHQERVGMGGKTFLTHKFRSMRVDAEAESGPVWATADDPRCTGAGRWLRRFSFDELPQLWNILRGEMSLVGPRGERPAFVKEFSERLPRYQDRHLVRPGLTGWAQANDLRGHTPVEDRLTYDLYYIENWSLAFDLKIILLTLARVWIHKNAY
jgi:exopolysaccharide biosynthesis polyprenyl glycosylphosphotransferase